MFRNSPGWASNQTGRPSSATACRESSMTEIIQVDELIHLVERILMRHGMSARNAAIVAATCVAAERDGALAHGFFRVSGYVSSLRSGWVDGAAEPTLQPGAASVVRVDARNG